MHILYHGDCLEIMPTLEANSVDTIITDPPYGLSFMGKDWDHGVPGVAFWREALRVAKPGAMLLAFGGTRTFHRLTCAIEDAGWEVRDVVTWLYGSGFPKSLDISKAIDKAAGEVREIVGRNPNARKLPPAGVAGNYAIHGKSVSVEKAMEYHRNTDANITAPATPAAQQWHGWGTALKPAAEMVIRAFKPLPDDTERGIIVGNLSQKESQLWLLSYVSTVENPSTLSLNGQSGVLSIAQWTVAEAINTRDALRGQMDMSQFASMVNTCLSTVTSWSNTLAALWADGSTFTTSMATSPTIDLKTLRFLLSQTTLESMVQCEMQAPGSRCNALPVGTYLNAVEASISSTLTLSALENATYGERTKRLDGTADPSTAWEPVILAMKPLDGTFAENALTWGVAGLNVDGARIGYEPDDMASRIARTGQHAGESYGHNGNVRYSGGEVAPVNPAGRWPANLLLDEDAARALDAVSGITTSKRAERGKGIDGPTFKNVNGQLNGVRGHDDAGGASRFFYVAKASRSDRGHDNTHPTCKPTTLMRYLCRLTATPYGGVVLDPFMGSGTTGVACMLEGRQFIGIEKEAEYMEIARRRIAAAELPLMREAAD